LKYYKGLSMQDHFRFIHLSTDEVFGALGLEGKFNESMPYRPNSPYAASKAASDHLVRAYRQTYGLPTIIVNSSNNYGPKQYPEKLIPLTILNALEGKPLPVYGDGSQIRDWLYVADHIEALYALIKQGQVGYSYCIGSDNEMTNLSLVHTICELVDQLYFEKRSGSCKQLITYVLDRPGHDFRYATDASRLKEHTGWKPRTNFYDGLRETVRWYADTHSVVGMQSGARKRIGLG
jgi:dTDP-glucose 4,6-dehydratase